jgi:catechol-2,3-dioxygenase
MDRTIFRSTKLTVRDLERAATYFHAVAGFDATTRFQNNSGA